VATIDVQAISKSFGDVAALNDVSLKIRDGELFCILGPSGAGKTTTLRCIAGLEKQESGAIVIDGKDAKGVQPSLRGLGMFFESVSLYPHKTAFENLAFPLRRRRVPQRLIAARVAEVAEILRVSHTLERRPATLSGGERQRVALGRALIRPARAFLLDEPLSNLDALLRVHMRAELKRLQAELSQTIVYATPDPQEALALADRICVLHRGVVQQIDTPASIYGRPANKMVATFVGTPPMNFVPCRLVGPNGRRRLDWGTFRIEERELSAPLGEDVVGRSLLLGIRPEDIQLREAYATSDHAISGTVYTTEPLGAKTVVDLQVADLLVKAVVRGVVEYDVGHECTLVVAPERVHVFDVESERMLV
jgi:multiple sugar transport system ATP-binding protein